VGVALAPVRSPADIIESNCNPVSENCFYSAACEDCHASASITYYCPDDDSTYTVAGGCCFCT